MTVFANDGVTSIVYVSDSRPMSAAEYQYSVRRPDLPYCSRCENGTKCACAVYPSEFPRMCGCMGFAGCPECPRGKPVIGRVDQA